MILRWLIASLHLLALGLGLGAIYARAKAFRGTLDSAGIARLLLADNLWGLASLLWLGTGLWRAFGGLEKGTTFYIHNPLFHAKITLFIVIGLLEIRPMITLLRWRAQIRRGETVDTSGARTFARISHAQAGFVVLMVFLAAALARGLPGGP